MLQLHPPADTVHLALDELVEDGILETKYMHDDDDEFFVEGLAPAIAGQVADIEDFIEQWEFGGSRLWLAALVGDWMAAHSEAIWSRDIDLMAITKERADHCRDLRISRLRPDDSDGHGACSHAALWGLGVDIPLEHLRPGGAW